MSRRRLCSHSQNRCENTGDAGYTDGVEAVDGKDALSKASDVDIVFTDWNMPVMDGLTLVKELMKSSTVPVIMVTTEGGQAQRL